jgi:hypothetical protein
MVELFVTVFVIGVGWTSARYCCRVVGVACWAALDKVCK